MWHRIRCLASAFSYQPCGTLTELAIAAVDEEFTLVLSDPGGQLRCPLLG